MLISPTGKPATMTLFRAELSQIALLSDETRWNRFMAGQKRICNHTLELLNSYYDWWILGLGKEKERRKPQSIDENLLFPDKEVIASAELDKFHALYPAIFFALCHTSSITTANLTSSEKLH